MKNKINWNLFAKFAPGLLLFFLLLDMIKNYFEGKPLMEKVWAMDNIFFKVLASLVGAYFASTFNDNETNANNKE